jgi:hypothetical protein
LIVGRGELTREGVEGEEKQGRGGAAAVLKGGARRCHVGSRMRRGLDPVLFGKFSCAPSVLLGEVEEKEKREKRKKKGNKEMGKNGEISDV